MKLHDTESPLSLWNLMGHRTNRIINLYYAWQKDGHSIDEVSDILDDLNMVEKMIITSGFNNSIFLDTLDIIRDGLRLVKLKIFSKRLTRFYLITDEAFIDLVKQFENKYSNFITANYETKEIWFDGPYIILKEMTDDNVSQV